MINFFYFIIKNDVFHLYYYIFYCEKFLIFFTAKKKTPSYYRWRKRISFFEKQCLAHRRVVRINKAHITASLGVVLIGNQRFLVVLTTIGEFQLSCRDIAINNGSGIIIQDIHLELNCRIQLLQFLQNSIANVFQ